MIVIRTIKIMIMIDQLSKIDDFKLILSQLSQFMICIFFIGSETITFVGTDMYDYVSL